MLTLTKHQIGSWMLLDCLSQKQLIEEKIAFLEKKYNTNLNTFESDIEHSEK